MLVLVFADFAFLMNSNISKKDRYIIIFFNMLAFPAKGILSADKVCATIYLYDKNPHKL